MKFLVLICLSADTIYDFVLSVSVKCFSMQDDGPLCVAHFMHVLTGNDLYEVAI